MVSHSLSADNMCLYLQWKLFIADSRLFVNFICRTSICSTIIIYSSIRKLLELKKKKHASWRQTQTSAIPYVLRDRWLYLLTGVAQVRFIYHRVPRSFAYQRYLLIEPGASPGCFTKNAWCWTFLFGSKMPILPQK